MSEDTKIVKKIKALLAKADAERNDNENEREIAMRMAIKMMDEHSITSVQLRDEEDERGVGHAETKSSIWKCNVIRHIGDLYGCKVYRTSGRTGRTFVIGKESHRVTVLSLAEYVIHSIEREARRNHAGRGRKFIASFKKGSTNGLGHQVQELLEARKRGETTSASTALVVVGHYAAEMKANEEWLALQGVKLQPGRRQRASSVEGWRAGQTYGKSISLNNQVGRSPARRQLTHG